jgi:ribosome modulation factor
MTIDRRSLLKGLAAVFGAAAIPAHTPAATAFPPKREKATARATGSVWTRDGRLYQDGENGTEIELMPYQVEWLNKWSDAEGIRYVGQIG